MANGIFVIKIENDSVIAINADRFNPELHVKISSPLGDPWPISTPPVVPARDIVEPCEDDDIKREDEEEEIKEAPKKKAKPAAKKKVVKKGKK